MGLISPFLAAVVTELLRGEESLCVASEQGSKAKNSIQGPKHQWRRGSRGSAALSDPLPHLLVLSQVFPLGGGTRGSQRLCPCTSALLPPRPRCLAEKQLESKRFGDG